MNQLEKKYEHYGRENLLKAVAYYHLGEYERSVHALKSAQENLSIDPFISEHTWQYLKIYMHAFARKLSQKFGPLGFDVPSGEDCDFDQVSKTYSAIFVLK